MLSLIHIHIDISRNCLSDSFVYILSRCLTAHFNIYTYTYKYKGQHIKRIRSTTSPRQCEGPFARRSFTFFCFAWRSLWKVMQNIDKNWGTSKMICAQKDVKTENRHKLAGDRWWCNDGHCYCYQWCQLFFFLLFRSLLFSFKLSFLLLLEVNWWKWYMSGKELDMFIPWYIWATPNSVVCIHMNIFAEA